MCKCLLVFVTTVTLGVAAQSESAGMVDFGRFAPPGKGGEFVEVQIGGELIQFAAKLAEKQEPELAKLLRNVRLVRANVVGLTDDNRESVQQRIQKIRKELENLGWTRNVNVLGKAGEDVSVYTRIQEDETLTGVVVTVVEPNEAVFVNVVGAIKAEQIAGLVDNLHLHSLKKLHVGQNDQNQ